MDISELRDCTVERLIELEKNLRREIFEARIKNFTNQLDDTASMRRARRDLARVLTVLNERADDSGTEASDAPPDSAAESDAPPDDAAESDAPPDSAAESDAPPDSAPQSDAGGDEDVDDEEKKGQP